MNSASFYIQGEGGSGRSVALCEAEDRIRIGESGHIVNVRYLSRCSLVLPKGESPKKEYVQ